VLNAIPAVANAVTTSYINDGAVTQAKLGTGVAGNGPAFSAYASGTTSISAGTRVKITFATEVFDTNNNFASSRFTPTVAGYYQINLSYQDTGTSTILQAELYKNGSTFTTGGYVGTAAAFYMAALSVLVYMNGTTDYLEGYCYSSATASVGGSSTANFFNGSLVRAA
jgi:hypothetical protein